MSFSTTPKMPTRMPTVDSNCCLCCCSQFVAKLFDISLLLRAVRHRNDSKSSDITVGHQCEWNQMEI